MKLLVRSIVAILLFVFVLAAHFGLAQKVGCQRLPAQFIPGSKPSHRPIFNGFSSAVTLPVDGQQLDMYAALVVSWKDKGWVEQNDDPNGPLLEHVVHRNQGTPVRSYPDTITLQLSKAPPLVPGSPQMSFQQLPGAAFKLRFKVSWSGSVTHEAVEVQAEDKYEKWSEKPGPAVHWMEIQIPSDGIPVRDTLHIDVLSENGETVGCLTASLAPN